jgi:Kef-type K+ transport system membrane component KefB
MTLFLEISILLLLTTLVTLVTYRLKQPLVVGYILTGIIGGPYVLNIMQAQEEMELFSKVGIVLLLFIVGLHLNPRIIKEVGKISFIGGLGQIFLTTVVGFGIALLLDMSTLAALYVAIALTFSSTIIVLKLLSDKHDLQKLYAKITIGFLLMQDIAATIILVVVALFNGSSSSNLGLTIGLTLAKGLLMLVILLGMHQYILPKLAKIMAGSQKNYYSCLP